MESTFEEERALDTSMLEEALDFNGPELGNELILDEKLAKEPWIEEVTLS